MPEIVCVMPTYNSAHIVEMGVRSVLHQTFEDWELIVVDDSEDGTVDVVRAVAGDDPRVIVVSLDGRRPISLKRQCAVALSAAPFIAFFDCDDYQPPSRLALQHSCLAEGQAGAILHVPYPYWCDPRDPCLWRMRERLPVEQVVAGSTLFFSRMWWQLFGGYNCDGWDGCDTHMWRRIGRLGMESMPSPLDYALGFVGLSHGKNTCGNRLSNGRWERTDRQWRNVLAPWAVAICETVAEDMTPGTSCGGESERSRDD